MFRRFSANFALFSILVDLLMIALTLYVSTYLRVDISDLPLVREINEPVELPLILYIIFPLVWVGGNILFSVYDGRKNLRIIDELGSVTLGTSLAAISLAGILYLTFREVSRFLFIFFITETYMMLILWRLVIRLAFRWNWIGSKGIRRVLIVGAGVIGHQMETQIRTESVFGLKLVGFLDDKVNISENEKGILGCLSQVREIINEQQIDDVIIALPRSAHEKINEVVSELHDLPVQVWVIPDYFSLTLHRASVEDFAGIPMLNLRAPALNEYQRMIKRAFDLIFTILLSPFIVPIMVVIALIIKLDSSGTIFYKPIRVGENGKVFKMYKFRTMVEEADKLNYLVEKVDYDGKIIHKDRNDPRVTPVGKILRRTSLDEIPQLFNVIVGDMSLVGPRPEMPQLVENYDLWQRKRFAVPQGMTGWWQIHGRSDRPMHLLTEDDSYYVQHYSIWLDIKILIITIWAVLRGKGAY